MASDGAGPTTDFFALARPGRDPRLSSGRLRSDAPALDPRTGRRVFAASVGGRSIGLGPDGRGNSHSLAPPRAGSSPAGREPRARRARARARGGVGTGSRGWAAARARGKRRARERLRAAAEAAARRPRSPRDGRTRRRCTRGSTARTAYLQRCEAMQLVPQPVLTAPGNAQRAVDARGWALGDRQVAALADSVALCALDRVCLSGNRVTDGGAKRLLARVKPTLQALDLSDNALRSAATSGVLAALRLCRALTDLNLSGNQLHARAVGRVAKALAAHRAIVRLDLSRNRIDAKGAEALAALVRRSGTLAELRLSWCGLAGRARAGCAALLAALAQNGAIHTLDLSHNGIGGAPGAAATAHLAATGVSTTGVSTTGVSGAPTAAGGGGGARFGPPPQRFAHPP